MTPEEKLKPFRVILAGAVIVAILMVLGIFTHIQKENVIRNTEDMTNQMAEYVAGSITNEIDYAKSSIKLSAISIAQTMTSETFNNPAGVIEPMVESTPFGGIEYIRSDGMNVMNIGEPFDASDRVYYKEGIKGNTGVWNNYHPKTSKETLINFYTPLIYDGEISGVITGYIEATTQLAPLFETKLYGEKLHGLLLDENNMVICSTLETEFVKDLSLDMLMDETNATEAQKQEMRAVFENAADTAVPFMDADGEGRICVTTIPDTKWKVAIIVPAASFDAIVGESTKNSVGTIIIISVILVSYAASVLIRNIKKSKEIEIEISEIRDIISSANMGTWRIEFVEGKEPCMFVDETMKQLLGITGQVCTPEKTYTDWFSNIKPEAVPSVLRSVERMKKGHLDENTYLWLHPTKGERYVRCGGTAQEIPGGYLLRGYHYDVDEVVREEQAKVDMLQGTLDEKNNYYATLATLGDVFYSMHVIDLRDDTVIELNAKDAVRQIVNHKHGATEMMTKIMSVSTADAFKDDALQFTDLTTLADRMKDKRVISKQFIGNNTGWFLASFITMEYDEEARPTKVIYTIRVIDEEKKYEELLIQKSETDELTGLFNRRAYEEDIYAHNDTPEEDDFIYISLDVNGLKVVNDTLGHTAGDELIVGACWCMKETLGAYGKLYRIGGDEFVAILFVSQHELKEILAQFDEAMASWKGKLVDSLTISYGWISKEEQPDYSVRQLGAVAEQRMYADKDAHYRKSGVDRRGQQDAHKALCELYTKILKINLSEDSYQVINMDMDEQTREKGFANKISEWLASFGTSGQVHPEDLDEYLRLTDVSYMREYFASDKTSLHILYRRKYGDEFKQVMMEIIPANDYTDDNQSMFLYVKDIDK